MNATPCNFSSQKIEEIPVVVVACSPKFKLASGNILRIDPGPTTIWIDPNLDQDIRNAIQAALNDWPLVQPYVQFSQGPQQCGGGHCINFRPETSANEVPDGTCAGGQLDPVPGGGSGFLSANVFFPAAAGGWNANVLRHWVNHELGHVLGLDEYLGCASNKSLMAPVACNAVSGFPTTPPLTDSLPVNRTVYGGAPSASCP
jgi:hypothetical protein